MASCVPVALLYSATPDVALETLCATLNDVISPSGYQFELRDHTAGRDALFWHKDVGVRVDVSPRSRALTDFDGALGSEFQQLDGKDWAHVLASHKAHVAVRVETTAPPDADLYAFMLSLAHMTTNALVAAHPPLAVYWQQSDQLFDTQRFRLMEDMLFPLPLFVHPRLFSTGRMSEQTQVIGFHLQGAQDLVGCDITFLEAPQPLAWLISRTYALIEHIRSTAEIPADGSSFGTAPGERIRVQRDRTTGHLTLTLMEVEDMLMLQPDPSRLSPKGVAAPELAAARVTADVSPQDGSGLGKTEPADGRLRAGGASPDRPKKRRPLLVWTMVAIGLFFVPLVGATAAVLTLLRGPKLRMTAALLAAAIVAVALTGGVALRFSPADYLAQTNGIDLQPFVQSLAAPLSITF